MNKKWRIWTFTSLILGVIAGFTVPKMMLKIAFLGTIYINLLKFIIIPILVTNLVIAIYKSFKTKTTIKLFINALLTFLVLFIATFMLTSLVVIILKSGHSYNYPALAYKGLTIDLKIEEIITKLFPDNIITMLTSNSIFAIIIFSFVFGVVTSKTTNGFKIIDILIVLRDIFNKILVMIMWLTPLAVFSLIGTTIANYGKVFLNLGAKYIFVSYFCGLLAMFLILILPVCLIAKINPLTYLKKVYKVWIISFSTCSSLATLPTTLKVCNEEFKIDEKITNLVVPLGCTINMCGGAVSFALLGIFCMQMYGLDLNLAKYLMMLISAILINMAAPGIPSGGIVIGATYLMLLNIPLSFMGFYSSIYHLLDMNYTTLNVTGDISANILVNHYLKKSKAKPKQKLSI